MNPFFVIAIVCLILCANWLALALCRAAGRADDAMDAWHDDGMGRVVDLSSSKSSQIPEQAVQCSPTPARNIMKREPGAPSNKTTDRAGACSTASPTI